MKSFICLLAIVAGVGLLACGCANRNQPATATADANPQASTYSAQDLNKTGRHQTGPALEASDPSITATDGR